ncbi:hypothetical protein BUALT_Bualt07G0030700 [Buddleja alternifolia]|uniref:Uncharacterized protein n=1 Tax=Buddleja alternifolia TaxID=168488 RepID=A0AAV6X6X8_9LAMI|nr:hypothetical protein BUALT_Bualt07G0030700 [Buddleja alternifolia]
MFLYGDKASKSPDRTNEVTGVFAEQCVTLAKELALPLINLWAKMQETNGWQKKILSEAGFSDLPFDPPPPPPPPLLPHSQKLMEKIPIKPLCNNVLQCVIHSLFGEFRIFLTKTIDICCRFSHL